jgi:hypothetical protein
MVMFRNDIEKENELEALFADVAPSERKAMMRRLSAIAVQFKAAQAVNDSMLVECKPS